MAGHFRWFVGLGPRPVFDRFTYWEKFDYWAVFWGMAIIGGSGLMLWFPVLFSRILPGWVFNIALLVHGEEALLAVGFIFTIHFFNGHLRPEKFPMDMVIFTGRVEEHEFQAERPAEYARLTAAGPAARRRPALAARVADRPHRRHDRRRARPDAGRIDSLCGGFAFMRRHPLATIGVALATLSAFAFLFVFLADLFGLHTNPYLGIVFFLILPAFFVFGLLLIPLGAVSRAPPPAEGARAASLAPARSEPAAPPRGSCWPWRR